MITEFKLQQGTYILAVSGGVDSVALMHCLVSRFKDSRFIVCHFDHGIRANSVEDAQFVQTLAQARGLEFELKRAPTQGHLSEAKARDYRYQFLFECLQLKSAQAVITAHHQDDYLETMILNFMRGTNRRGYSSLKSLTNLIRPLLQVTKQQIIDYAQNQELSWREDATNLDATNLRNKIRLQIIPELDAGVRQKLLNLGQQLTQDNLALDQFLQNYLKHKSYRRQGLVFSRQWFNELGALESKEVVATWLRQFNVKDYDRRQIYYVTDKLKSLRPGKQIILGNHQRIELTKRSLRFVLNHKV